MSASCGTITVREPSEPTPPEDDDEQQRNRLLIGAGLGALGLLGIAVAARDRQ